MSNQAERKGKEDEEEEDDDDLILEIVRLAAAPKKQEDTTIECDQYLKEQARLAAVGVPMAPEPREDDDDVKGKVKIDTSDTPPRPSSKMHTATTSNPKCFAPPPANLKSPPTANLKCPPPAPSSDTANDTATKITEHAQLPMRDESLPGAFAQCSFTDAEISASLPPTVTSTSHHEDSHPFQEDPLYLEEGQPCCAELVEYEHADVLKQNVLLISLEEKERMALWKKRLLLVIAAMLLALGTAASVAFACTGTKNAMDEQEERFRDDAAATVMKIRDSFEEYVHAVALVHLRCRKRDFTRQDFRDLYEYLTSGQDGLRFKAVQYMPNVTHEERPAREADSRAFYARHYPHVDYQGFVGFNQLNASGGLQQRNMQPWYFPVHYMEPIAGNEAAIDLDYHSSEVRIRAVEAVFDHAKPSLSDRLNLVKKEGSISRCGIHNGPSYGVVLAHPGVNLTRTSNSSSPFSNLDDYGTPDAATTPHQYSDFVDDVWPRDMATMVICIPDLLKRSMHQQLEKAVYIHDSSPLLEDSQFMGGAQFRTKSNVDEVESNGGHSSELVFLDEVPLEVLKSPSSGWQRHLDLKYQDDVQAANRVWTVTVVALEGTYQPEYAFVFMGGAMIFVGTLLLALWVYKKATTSDSADSEGDSKNKEQ